MIRLLFSLLLSIVSISILAQTNPIAGKWLTVDDSGDSLIIELTKDKAFYLISVSEKDTIGGLNKYDENASDDEDSIFIDHKYILNLNVYPHRLELTAYHAGTDSFEYIIPCFFEFRENGSIALVLYDEGIFREDGDDPDLIRKEFYTNAKIDGSEFEATIFKPLK